MSETNQPDELDKARTSALRLVPGLEPLPRDVVLDGIIAMTETDRPLSEEDINIAKLQQGMLFIVQMGDARVTDAQSYMASYLNHAFGSTAGIKSPKAKAQNARLLSSFQSLREAFEQVALAPSSGLEKDALIKFMAAKYPSDFWQQPKAADVAISNILESYNIAGEIAQGLETPLTAEDMLRQVEGVLEDALGFPRLPAAVSDFEKARRQKQLEEFFEVGWNDWLETMSREHEQPES